MKVNISYQTLQVPPPFAFAYTLNLEWLNERLTATYHLEFLDRDTLSPEEIAAEGYSEDDDFSWSGELDQTWAELLQAQLADVDLQDESEDMNVYLFMEITDEESNEESGHAEPVDEWDMRLQEVIQAIYEKAGVEEPLKMTIQWMSGKDLDKYKIQGSFVDRSASINGQNMDWETLHDLMRSVYEADFEEAKPKKSPTKDGIWVDLDQSGQFFHLDTLAQKSDIEAIENILGQVSTM